MTRELEKDLRRRIPSMSALLAFDCAGRMLNFTRAAEELNVTQSAVSRHIRGLEEQLGVTLFHRAAQRVALTSAGTQYLAAVGACLSGLEAATLTISVRARPEAALALATLPTFGARWLVSRLPQFAERHPEFPVTLSVSTGPLEAGAAAPDAAIFYGVPATPGMVFDRVFGSELVAVCSPSLLESYGGGDLRWLGRHRLMELGVRGAWRDLLKQLDYPELAARNATYLEYFSVGIEAAISGQGVLLAPLFLILQDIEERRLAIVGRQILRPPLTHAYYLAYAERNRALPPLLAFRDWVVAAARDTVMHCEALLAANASRN